MSATSASAVSGCSSTDVDDALFAEAATRRRQPGTEEDYREYCACVCRTGKLRSGRLRALVWRDVVLGRRTPTPVPLLGEGIVRQFQEETRSQATGQHSRDNTNIDDSFDSTLSRPTPRAGGEGGVEAEGAGAQPLSARSDGADSSHSTALSSSANATSPAAALHHRHRHRSVEAPRALRTSPLNRTVEPEAHAAPIPLPAVRRRAKSQLSRRVKADVGGLDDVWRPAPADGGASSGTDTAAGVLRPMAWYHLPENCQPRVVEADIERSLWKLYTAPEERIQRRRCLKNTLLRVLLHNPDRYYYQGLHELMGFVMYVVSPYVEAEEVVSLCEALLNTRWRQFSARRLTNSEAMLYAVHAVIAAEDPPLAAALEWCGVGPESHYAVSWVITWYAHSVEKVAVLTRLFDYFVADATGTAVVYFTAAFVMSQRATIFEWIHAAKKETGVSVDAMESTEDGIVLMARVYAQLSRLPGSVLPNMAAEPLEALLRRAETLSTQYADAVTEAEASFLRGEVKKLGMLSNANTRNAALRLLWHFLPREWRNPAKVERVRRFVFWTSVVMAATAVVVGTAAVDAKQGGWVRNLFH